MHLDYYPPPTIDQFHLDDNFVRILVGPLGSAKTFGMIMETLRRSVEQAPNSRGLRQTRFAIVRQTRPQITSTILPEIDQALGPLTFYQPSKSSVFLKMTLDDGTHVDSEWLLMPLEEINDQKRLLSLNLTGVWCSEVRELNYDLVQSILGRVGRFPSQADVGPSWFGMYGETNPWSVANPWHQHLVLHRPAEWSLYRQPGGLSPDAENLHNLPGGRDYYHRLMQGSTAEWVDVHVHAKWGHDKAGTPVYSSTFDPEFHTSPNPLQVNPQRPLLLLQDFGRTPTTLIAQVTLDNRLNILHEVTCRNMGIELFCTDLLIPTLATQRFVGMAHHMVADPSGAFADQRGEESLFDVLRRVGFSVDPAPTDKIDPRIRAVEAAFLQQRSGRPLIYIDRTNCPLLCDALEFGYKFGMKKDGQMEETPRKTHPESDLADDLGYGCLYVFGAQSSFDAAKHNRRGRAGRPFHGSPPVSVAGWT